jgi:hypothetical protein
MILVLKKKKAAAIRASVNGKPDAAARKSTSD